MPYGHFCLPRLNFGFCLILMRDNPNASYYSDPLRSSLQFDLNREPNVSRSWEGVFIGGHAYDE